MEMGAAFTGSPEINADRDVVGGNQGSQHGASTWSKHVHELSTPLQGH